MLFLASRSEASARMCLSFEDDPMFAWLCALAHGRDRVFPIASMQLMFLALVTGSSCGC